MSKFRRGLRRDIEEAVAEKVGLVLDDPERWYSQAKEIELVGKFSKAYNDIGATPTRSFIPYRSTTTQPSTPTSSRTTPDPRPMTDTTTRNTPPAKLQAD